MLAQVLELMELETIKGALVGVPGVSGLSVEQRKRLTIGAPASWKHAQTLCTSADLQPGSRAVQVWSLWLILA